MGIQHSNAILLLKHFNKKTEKEDLTYSNGRYIFAPDSTKMSNATVGLYNNWKITNKVGDTSFGFGEKVSTEPVTEDDAYTFMHECLEVNEYLTEGFIGTLKDNPEIRLALLKTDKFGKISCYAMYRSQGQLYVINEGRSSKYPSTLKFLLKNMNIEGNLREVVAKTNLSNARELTEFDIMIAMDVHLHNANSCKVIGNRFVAFDHGFVYVEDGNHRFSYISGNTDILDTLSDEKMEEREYTRAEMETYCYANKIYIGSTHTKDMLVNLHIYAEGHNFKMYGYSAHALSHNLDERIIQDGEYKKAVDASWKELSEYRDTLLKNPTKYAMEAAKELSPAKILNHSLDAYQSKPARKGGKRPFDKNERKDRPNKTGKAKTR